MNQKKLYTKNNDTKFLRKNLPRHVQNKVNFLHNARELCADNVWEFF
jgi:hypothetical protein